MKKALIIVALFLVPFLSVRADIWTDGSIDLQHPKSDLSSVIDCGVSGSGNIILGRITVPGSNLTQPQKSTACMPKAMDWINAREVYTACEPISSIDTNYFQDIPWFVVHYIAKQSNGVCNEVTSNGNVSIIANLIEEIDSKFCPPDSFPTYLAIHTLSETNFMCYDPAEANQNDSCNVNSGNEYLTIDVSEPSGCFPQSDGSICKYDSVDIGGGNNVYAMDLEGDCYSNSDGLPDLDGAPKPDPVNDECVSYGNGIAGCPEDPANVCGSGSSYAGGSIADCQTGCGMVNDQFMCIDQDTDGDGLPDYNDPDIDGDGIPNGDDLDSDGDGQDDPINGQGNDNGNGDGNGTGEPLDLSPVVGELKKLNDAFGEAFKDGGIQPDLDDKEKLTNLNTSYEEKLTGLTDKTATQLGYIDSLGGLSNRTGLTASLPSNECVVYSFHPAGKTVTLDTCVVALKIKPILAWLFGLLTAWHIFFTINKTLREGV